MLYKKEERRQIHRDTKIIGCYIDIYDKPKETYLGYDIKGAKRRVPIEKTWCYPTFYELQHATYYDL